MARLLTVPACSRHMGYQGEITDVDYRTSDGEVEVRVFLKLADGREALAVDSDFYPYLYVFSDEEDAADLQQRILDEELTDDDGDELPVLQTEIVEKQDLSHERKAVKVYSNIPANIPKLRHAVKSIPTVEKCMEYDIPFYRRYLVDNKLSPAQTVRVEGEEVETEDHDLRLKNISIESVNSEKEVSYSRMAFDLEVYEDTIIMASVKTQDEEKLITFKEIDRDFVEVVENEEQLLLKLIDLIREHDIIYGYNTDEFDFQNLRDRVRHYGHKLGVGRAEEKMRFTQRGRFKGARVKGRVHLDIYPFVAHILSPGMDTETLDLDSVAEELLGKNKDDMTWEEMKENWENEKNLEEFADYAMKDAELAFELGEEIQPQIFEMSKIAGLIPFDTCRLTYGQLTENFLIKEAVTQNRFIQNRPKRQEQRERQRKEGFRKTSPYWTTRASTRRSWFLTISRPIRSTKSPVNRNSSRKNSTFTFARMRKDSSLG